MDLIIFSSEYKNFRDAVLNNIPDVNGAIRCISNAIPPICNILNIGFIKVKLVAPVSLIARQGTNEEKIIYEDPHGCETAPIIQTYRTGENGIFIARDKDNMPDDLSWGLIEGRVFTYAFFE